MRSTSDGKRPLNSIKLVDWSARSLCLGFPFQRTSTERCVDGVLYRKKRIWVHMNQCFVPKESIHLHQKHIQTKKKSHPQPEPIEMLKGVREPDKTVETCFKTRFPKNHEPPFQTNTACVSLVLHFVCFDSVLNH